MFSSVLLIFFLVFLKKIGKLVSKTLYSRFVVLEGDSQSVIWRIPRVRYTYKNLRSSEVEALRGHYAVGTSLPSYWRWNWRTAAGIYNYSNL